MIAALLAAAALALPPLPAHWPHTLQLGLAQSPDDVRGQFGFRYQYLAAGWTGWNPDGSFASRYARESWARGTIPVFSYYVLLQSSPGSGDEAQRDLAALRDPQTAVRYWADVRLLFARIHGAKPSAPNGSWKNGANGLAAPGSGLASVLGAVARISCLFCVTLRIWSRWLG